jgi:hypothetical protein
MQYDVCNELAILALRVAVVEGKIKLKDTPIMIAYEGKELGPLTPEGKLPEGPPGFCDLNFTLNLQGQMASMNKTLASVPDCVKEEFAVKYRDWFKENVTEIITPGTKFYLAPDAAAAKEIQQLEQRQVMTAKEWVEEDGHLLLVTGKHAIPAEAVVACAFDMTGSRYITVKFDVVGTLATLGVKPEEF